MLHTRVMSSDDFNTDHKLVRPKSDSVIKPAVKKRGAQVKKPETNTLWRTKLSLKRRPQPYMRRRNRSLAPVAEAKNHSPGDYSEIRRPLHEKAHDHVTKTAYRDVCSNFQLRLREIQRKWWLDLVDKKQFCTGIGNSKAFSKPLRAVYSPMHQI